jgi:hypothetical protein
MLLALLCLTATAGAAAARDSGGPPPPPFPRFGGSWSHAEINVRIKREYHTLVLDNGRIVQVSPAQMTLRERDGSLVTIALSDQTLVTIRGHAASVYELQRKMQVQAMRIDDGPAVRVRAAS